MVDDFCLRRLPLHPLTLRAGILLPPGPSCSSRSQAEFSSPIIDTTLPSSLIVSYPFLSRPSSFLEQASLENPQALKASRLHLLKSPSLKSFPSQPQTPSPSSGPCSQDFLFHAVTGFPLPPATAITGQPGGVAWCVFPMAAQAVMYYSHCARM
jgi:hypothetical protein